MSDSWLIASWNVNSLRVRLGQVLRVLDEYQPDILALQETKVQDADFPLSELSASGYHCLFAGQKTYNGVALLARDQALTLAMTEFPDFPDPSRRVLVSHVGDMRIVNVYVPNGSEVGSDKYAYKLNWLQGLIGFLGEDAQTPSVVLGDFNIAPDDRDVHDPALWQGRILCSEPERAALARLEQLGYRDCYRLQTQDAGVYSWWDYRAASFRRNLGLRIDLLLANAPLAERCLGAGVWREPRAWEQASDHAPVWARFARA